MLATATLALTTQLTDHQEAVQQPKPSQEGRGLWSRLIDWLGSYTVITVEPAAGSTEPKLWYVCNPMTGEIYYAEAESEAMEQLERRMPL